MGRGLAEPVVGLADRGPEWLVVQMEEPPAMQRPRRHRRGPAALDEHPDEVGALLAVDDVCELAVLPFHEDAGV